LQYLFQLSLRTSQNDQKAKFAEYLTAEIQLRRLDALQSSGKGGL
jgi:hypothetical protein